MGLTNNDIFKKLRVAHKLRDTDIIKICALVDFKVSKAELGALFRSEKATVAKQNLVVFLRPTILRDKLRTKEITDEKFKALWELNLGIKEDRGRIRERSEGDIIPQPAVESLFEGNRLNDTVNEDEPEDEN